MIQNKKNIAVDYYEGSYGPTIRIDTFSIQQLIDLRGIISKLKDGIIDEFNIRNINGISITGMKDLILKRKIKKRFFHKKIKQTKDGLIFIWELTSEQWWHCEGLIDGLIDANNPGHQYLLEDEVVIEFCFMEVQ